MPECFLDTNLVEVLLECVDAVNHKKGNSSVIDDDKVKVKGLNEFDKIERLWKSGLKLFRYPGRNHYVVQLSPAIERWLLNECSKGGINLSEYGLPENLKGLEKMKGLSQRKDEKFKRLFKDMLKKDKCNEMIELKRWLLFFKENNYKTNLDLL
jgi:hypothetical protein